MKKATSYIPKLRILTFNTTSILISESVTEGNDSRQRKIIRFFVITLIIMGLTAVLWEIGYVFTLVNIALLYMLPVLITAVRWGIWTSFYAAVISVIAFDFFFVPPLFTFTVADARYLISFTVYLAVAVFTASLGSQLRGRIRESREREIVSSALFSLSTQVAASGDLDSILGAIVRQSFETFGIPAKILLPNSRKQLNTRASYGFQDVENMDNVEPNIMEWVYEHGEMAGYGTNTYNDTSIVYLPLRIESKTHGVMCFASNNQIAKDRTNNRMLVIKALSSLAAVSIARVHFEEEAKVAHLTAESERLRTALLDSISHELRTPLATIIGAATALTESRELLSTDDQDELLSTMREGSLRMNRLVTNLLDMVRLQSGMLRLNKDWCDIADIVGVALRQIQDSLHKREITVNIPDIFPVISVDDVLIEQVLVNLLNNAIKYSPSDSPIQIDVEEHSGIMTLRIRDFGIGIQPDENDKIFDKFFRSPSQKSISGTGLGLAICKGIIQAHGGEIFARNAENKGLIVTIRLPVGDADELLNKTLVQSMEAPLWEQRF